MKTFTLDEAQTLLPILDGLLQRAVVSKQEAEAVDAELQRLTQHIFLAGGVCVDIVRVALRRAAREKAIQRARDAVAEIDAIGVQVKDLDSGLLDFPCQLGDEVVLLCWRMGEPAITHWHRVEDGYQGRQPVDERFGRRKPKERPN